MKPFVILSEAKDLMQAVGSRQWAVGSDPTSPSPCWQGPGYAGFVPLRRNEKKPRTGLVRAGRRVAGEVLSHSADADLLGAAPRTDSFVLTWRQNAHARAHSAAEQPRKSVVNSAVKSWTPRRPSFANRSSCGVIMRPRKKEPTVTSISADTVYTTCSLKPTASSARFRNAFSFLNMPITKFLPISNVRVPKRTVSIL